MSEIGHGGERPRKIGRDTFLKGLALTAATVIGGHRLVQDAAPSKEDEQRDRFMRPFRGRRANDIAERIGINAGSFFRIPSDILNGRAENAFTRSTAFVTEKSLLPIFPPAVHDHNLALAKAAGEFDVPINVLATVATVESAGNEGIRDGMFQIEPKYHFDRIMAMAKEVGHDIPGGDALLREWSDWTQSKDRDREAPPVRIPEVQALLANPEYSSRIAAGILKDYHERVVKNTNFPADGPLSWSRALASYNGGPDAGLKPYQDLEPITKFYIVHALRFFMTGEIAAQVRRQGALPVGLSDEVVAKELVSDEIDARAFAYREVDEENVGVIWDALTSRNFQSERGGLTEKLRGLYQDYKKGKYKFDLPISAGLRLWLVQGGDDTYVKAPANQDLAKYPAARR